MHAETITFLGPEDILQQALTDLETAPLTDQWAEHGAYCVYCAIARARGDLEDTYPPATMEQNDGALRMAAVRLDRMSIQPDANRDTALAALRRAVGIS